MKRTAILTAFASALLMSACGGDSSLPVATGKASITAINAIPASPGMGFLIEERVIGTVGYQDTSSLSSYDDLDYTFSFDVFFAGDAAATRIASQHIDFVADQHYTLLATGTLAAPVLTVWEETQREFADSDTVFQARFAHTSESLRATTIDVYFALDGVAPVLGEQVATLNFGEISGALDFAADDYVVIITTSGNALDVLFTSKPASILARTDLIVTPFDGDANNAAALVVRGLSSLGGLVVFPDLLALPTVQFLHAAMEMGTSDVYDDDLLTSQILANHAFRDLTADTDIAVGSNEYFYTPAGDTSTVALQTAFAAAGGFHHRVTAVGTGGAYSTTNAILDRRSIDTAAKLMYFQSSNNFDVTDLYLVDAGTTIDGQAPFGSVTSRLQGAPIEVAAGSYDLYITDFGATDILAGPFSLDLAFGDVVDMVVFDTVDPVVLDIVVYPLP